MRLTANKTWSQQELAIKLHIADTASRGLLSWERRRLLIHAAKTALAAGLCWWLASRLGLHDGYWGAISAIIVLQSNFGATITASRDRVLGTLIGALFGFSFSLLGTVPWNYILAVFAAIVICGLLGFRSSSRLAGVTITIIMLVQSSSHWTLALTRVGQVLFGILVAVAVSTLVFPDRARLHLRDGLAQEFLVLGAFFEGILEGFRGAPAEDIAQLREDARVALASNDQLLDASRHEPSGGPGWREGLGMLVQSGHALFDALAALQLAVKDSCRRSLCGATGAGIGEAGAGRSNRVSSRGALHTQLAFRRATAWATSRRGYRPIGRAHVCPAAQGNRIPAGGDSAGVCSAVTPEAGCPDVARIARGDEPGGRRSTKDRVSGLKILRR